MHTRSNSALFPLSLETIEGYSGRSAFRVAAAAPFAYKQMPFNDAHGFLLAVTANHFRKYTGHHGGFTHARNPCGSSHRIGTDHFSRLSRIRLLVCQKEPARQKW